MQHCRARARLSPAPKPLLGWNILGATIRAIFISGDAYPHVATGIPGDTKRITSEYAHRILRRITRELHLESATLNHLRKSFRNELGLELFLDNLDKGGKMLLTIPSLPMISVCFWIVTLSEDSNFQNSWETPMVDLQIGEKIRIPCTASQGAFPDEWLVSFDTAEGPVSGFVKCVQEFEGEHYIIGRIEEVRPSVIAVRVEGSFFTTTGLAYLSTDAGRILRAS